MWVSEVWLYGLFVRTLTSRTDAYAGCGRPTLNFIERFELGSLRSDSEATSHRLSRAQAALYVQIMLPVY